RLPPNTDPVDIASRAGAVWVTEERLDEGGHLVNGDVLRISTADGSQRRFRVPGYPGDPGKIVRGRDHAMWFTNENALDRIDSAGSIREFDISQSQWPDALAIAPNG